MAGDINSAELCLKAVNVLQEELKNARKTLINSETCVVNRSVMTAQLEYLRENIPDTVDKAAEIYLKTAPFTILSAMSDAQLKVNAQIAGVEPREGYLDL